MFTFKFKEISLWFKAMTGEKLSSAALHAHRGNATLIVPHFWKPDEPVCNRCFFQLLCTIYV